MNWPEGERRGDRLAEQQVVVWRQLEEEHKHTQMILLAFTQSGKSLTVYFTCRLSIRQLRADFTNQLHTRKVKINKTCWQEVHHQLSDRFWTNLVNKTERQDRNSQIDCFNFQKRDYNLTAALCTIEAAVFTLICYMWWLSLGHMVQRQSSADQYPQVQTAACGGP